MNQNVSLEEEIDFGGLEEYIRSDLMDDIKQRFWGDIDERCFARQRILEKAVSYATANTNLSARRTMKIVGQVIDVLRKFYRDKVNSDLLFVATEVEEHITTEHEKTRELIKGELHKMDTGLTADRAIHHAEAGQLPVVEEKIATILNAMSTQHTLFPYYGFRMNENNKMVSIPLSDDAREKYPENMRITANAVQLGNDRITSLDGNILRKAYRHQIPIWIDIEAAKKYLGDVPDPQQSEADELIGTRAVIKPPSFPPAIPCKVIVGNDVLVPYLLMRTKEILDDDTYVITNDEQRNFPYHVEIELYPHDKKTTFKIRCDSLSNRDALDYRLFLRRITTGEQIKIQALNMPDFILSGSVNQPYDGAYDAEIGFLKKIVAIEDYFKVEIGIPGSISMDDHKEIDQLFALINGRYDGGWDNYEFKFLINEDVRQHVLDLTESKYGLAFVADMLFDVFGTKITVPIIRRVYFAKVANLERLKEKMQVLDNGDEIKVAFLPATDGQPGKFYDCINKDDELEVNTVFIDSIPPTVDRDIQ